MILKHYNFETENNRSNNIINLKDFKLDNLSITNINCMDRLIYYIDYSKNNNTMPLCLKMSYFYGYVEIINDRRILKIVQINLNDNFLNDYKKVLGNIINNINEFWYNSEYVFDDNYFKIIIDVDRCEDEKIDDLNVPIGCLLKFDMAVVSCRLAIEKDDTLNIELYLQKCLIDDDWFKH